MTLTAFLVTAIPVDSATLTDNLLYRSGKMAPVECREKPVSSMNRSQARKYFEAVNTCLVKAWRAQLKKVGLHVVAPGVSFLNRPRKYCGAAWDDVAGRYCQEDFGYAVLLDRDLLEYPGDLFMMDLAAHEFAHHLQNLTGILYAAWLHPTGGGLGSLELDRRRELQAECLAGVFIASTFASLNRPKSDVAELKDMLRRSGSEEWQTNIHGKGRNQVAWFTRGFESRDPKSCNTWIAKPSKVA